MKRYNTMSKVGRFPESEKMQKNRIPLGMHLSVENAVETFVLHPVRDASLTGCKMSRALTLSTERRIPHGMQTPKNATFLRQPNRPDMASRSGLSLFEILAAMFVLMVGLLGVLAVLPFGLYQMNRVNKADFGSNCGRAAVQEIQVRGWAADYETSFYDPYNRDLEDEERVAYKVSGTSYGDPPIYMRYNRPFIVDPLLFFSNSDNINDSRLKTFPASIDDAFSRVICLFSGMEDGNGVIDHTKWNQTTVDLLKKAVFDTFYWKDDRNFSAPADKVVQIPRPVGVIGSDQKIQSHENYSWLYMLTPQVRGIQDRALARESDIDGYNIDVVVFFNRNTDLETLQYTERYVSAARNGVGYRGGSFTISADTAEELDMTDIRWLLLSCPKGNTMFAKWYRIVNFRDIEFNNGKYSREIMLFGPDVPESDATNKEYGVTLAQGAIHVFSSVVKK